MRIEPVVSALFIKSVYVIFPILHYLKDSASILKNQSEIGPVAMILSHSSTLEQIELGSEALRAMKPGTLSRPVGIAGSLYLRSRLQRT